VFKVAGGLYLAYLGSRSLIGGIRKARTGGAADGRPVQPVTDRAALRQGLVSNLLNPKAGAIFATVLPQFINRDDPVVRLLLMLVAYEAILLGWLTLYGYGVSRAGRSQAVGGVRRAMERVTGVVLISLGIRLALERR
jgi:threonine/homoserine/homoserine lactone efflux protein